MRSPGLIFCGSRIHAASHAGVLGISSAASDVREARWVRFGSHGALRGRARDGVAARALGVHEQLPAGLGLRGRRRGRRALLGGQPRPERRGPLGEHLQGHVGVLHPAELRALPPVLPRLGGVEQHPVAQPRDHVDLAVERRHPEAVDHVRRRRHHVDAGVDRDVDLVGGDGAAVRVAHLPPPLMADDVDRQPGAARIRRRGLADQIHVRDPEQGHEGDQRHRHPEQQDHALRHVLALADERQPRPVPAPPRDHQHGHRAQEHHGGRRQHPPPQQRDVVRRLAVRAEDRLLAAPGDPGRRSPAPPAGAAGGPSGDGTKNRGKARAGYPAAVHRRKRCPAADCPPRQPDECWSVSPTGVGSSLAGMPGSLSRVGLCEPPSAPGSPGRSSGASASRSRSSSAWWLDSVCMARGVTPPPSAQTDVRGLFRG